MKICPICNSNKVITFDSDNDWCEHCRKYFPTVAPVKCVAGCKAFAGGEIKHHKNCYFYPESFSKMYNDLENKHNDLINDISTIAVQIQEDIIKGSIAEFEEPIKDGEKEIDTYATDFF